MRVVAFILAVMVALAVLARVAHADECRAGSTCVPQEDLEVFVKLLQEQKCRNENPPKFQLDGITIIEDQDGRIYGSGSDPKPYTLHMNWCNYEVTATGKVQLFVAKREPPFWGFRFRPKFQSGFLFTDAIAKENALSAIDVGVLLEGFYYRSVNLNLAAGFRSVGAGVGLDITKNFGAYAGYALSYDGLRSNPYLGLSFAFW